MRGSVFAVLLLSAIALTGTAASALVNQASQAAPATPELSLEALTGDSVRLSTSSDWSALLNSEPTSAEGKLLLSQSCASVGSVSVGMISESGQQLELDSSTFPKSTQTASSDTTKPNTWTGTDFKNQCVATIKIMSGPRDPAAGQVLLSRKDKPTISIPYTIERTSSPSVYLGLLVTAAVVALLTTGGAILLSIGKTTGTITSKYKFSDGWATTITAVGAAGGALLTSAGVLNDLLPQYQTGGVLASSLVIGLLLALAPVLFLTATSDDHSRALGLYAAMYIALVAIYGQLSLTALIVLAAGASGGSIAVIVLIAAGIATIILFYTRARIIDAYSQTDTPVRPLL